MATFTWDAELAEKAAMNVRQCEMNHDECMATGEITQTLSKLMVLIRLFDFLQPNIHTLDRIWQCPPPLDAPIPMKPNLNKQLECGLKSTRMAYTGVGWNSLIIFESWIPISNVLIENRGLILVLNVICFWELFRRTQVGHFTQVVRDEAHAVGCAASRYTQGGWNTVLVACNYSNTNMIGQSIYKAGRTASGCKTGRNPKYPGLCSESEYK